MSPTFVYVVNLLLVLLLVLANAFFVVSEFSIVKMRRTKLEELAHSGNKRAQIALKIHHKMDTYLSAIQLGITLASLGLGWIARCFRRAYSEISGYSENRIFRFDYCLSPVFV